MRRSALLAATTVAGAALIGSIAEGDRKSKGGGEYRPLGSDASFTTVHTNTLGLEGLTADTAATSTRPRATRPDRARSCGCPRAAGRPRPSGRSRRRAARPASRSTATASCSSPTATEIHRLRPSASSPPTATVFATGVPGANGVAFDRRGDLWVSDGGTGQGRVWRIGDDGAPHEVFRVQPMVNDVNVDATGGRRHRPRPALGAARRR